MELAIGFLLGTIASMLAWYILFHKIVPKIEFFPNIYREKTAENPSGYRYLFRLKNIGKRDIIDVELIAKLRIRGIYEHKKYSWKAIYIPLDDNRIPKIKSQKRNHKRIAVQICPTEIKDIAKRSIPDEFKLKLEQETLLLEDLFKLGDESEFQIFGFGYDSLSGSRKEFESKVFNMKDIIDE
jgi:hypothetical protein